MATDETTLTLAALDPDYDEPLEWVTFEFTNSESGSVSRRTFVQTLGAGLLIAVTCGPALAQERPGGGERRGGRGGGRGGGGFRGGGAKNVAARVHIAKDGALTVMTGKVEGGQGARAEITQAAAEELRVAPDKLKLVMADTELTPDDGVTAGSRSTPGTLPSVRQGCAAARNLLADLAAQRWGFDGSKLEVRDGKVTDTAAGRTLTYGDLASADDAAALFAKPVPQDVALAPAGEWKVLGTSVLRPNARDVVTGSHKYPSDVQRPGMLYGKVLRLPSYNAKLESVDLAPAKAMPGVVTVQDGSFVAIAAPTTFLADDALATVAEKAKWQPGQHPSSSDLYSFLRKYAKDFPLNPFSADVASAAKSLKQTYHVPYVQHSPMEPRAAVAEWDAAGKLTVWTATQNPFGVRGELVRTFGMPEDKVRVIVPDFGGGFGGKHTGECAVEAARIAKAAGKPVCLRWTREEEFTWAYFRPAAVIETEASLGADGALASWYFINVNSGPSAVETPYRVPRDKNKTQFVQSEPPLRHGSYRALASTANVFARECFMDELAEAAGKDPLAFRLAHLEAGRLRDVLEAAAKKFDFAARFAKKQPGVGVGIACGTEKASFVAACVEVAVDAEKKTVAVRRVCQAYECGAIVNPENLRKQVEGAVLMGLGPALREEMQFEGGKITNAAFSRYAVPRFADVPELEVHLLNRPDLPSVGAGETPLIAVAPAIANAVHHATGVRVRQMPIRL
jgi:isoquinoline 1-oxidoreductase